MNFMFSWQEQYLTRSLYSLVRYYSCHLNIKFISSCHLVIFSISSVSALSVLIIVTLWLNFWLRNGKSYHISLNTKQLWYNNIVPINYMSILVPPSLNTYMEFVVPVYKIVFDPTTGEIGKCGGLLCIQKMEILGPCRGLIWAYLPTPKVQKPGDNPKNFQSGSHFY